MVFHCFFVIDLVLLNHHEDQSVFQRVYMVFSDSSVILQVPTIKIKNVSYPFEIDEEKDFYYAPFLAHYRMKGVKQR